MSGKKFHKKTMTSLGFHFFLLWSQWGSIPQFMNLEINLEFHIWKQIYFFWCSKKIVQCSLWCPAMSFLSFVERHETPGVPRLPVCWVSAYQPRVQPPDDQQWGCARQRPQGPKGPRPRRPEGPPSAQATFYKSLQGTHIMSLEAERRVDKEKGKVGIIKKVCESKSNPTSLTSSFLKATFEGGFSSWTCHTQEKRPALMITRYLLLSFFCKTFEF